MMLLLSTPCQAAFKSVNDPVDPLRAWNPRPLKDDIVLPMPCGLSLAMRAISVPAGALIRDKTFTMGISNPQNKDRQIYERQFQAHIAAPFTKNDLPTSWSLRKSASDNDAWYFLGKYEISRLQWMAVMDALSPEGAEDAAMCPKIDQSSNQPITGISWFEAQEFLNKYNAWLVKNHPSSLPAFSGTKNIAFLRLPTEEEWEYAARGGNRVPPEWWADKDIFPFEENRTLKDYAVTSEDGSLQSPLGIGSRLPNPLGLHDTAGNANEIVDGFFRLSIPDMANGQVIRRLHGAAGGILTKGGSFRSQADAVMPGWRDEMPLYTANGPSKSADTGFRIVLAALNIPSAKRLDELRIEAGKALPEKEGSKIIEGNTPIELIDSLVANSAPENSAPLNKLRSLITDQDAARRNQDLRNLEQSFRSLLYQSETLRAFAFRYSSASKQVDKIRELLKGQLSQQNRINARDLLASGEKDLKDYLQSLQMGAKYYLATLEAISKQPPQEIERLIAQCREEYGSGTIFDQHMRQNINNLSRYVAEARNKGISSLSPKTILRGILPEQHYRQLPI